MSVHSFPLRMLPVYFALAATSQIVLAEDPMIAFDFGRTAECRDVTPVESQEIYPDEKVVELKLNVSVHLLAGNMSDVDEIRIEIGDCDHRMRVHSFEPSTRLESKMSEDIQWTKTTEKNKTFGASLGGEAPVPLGDVVAHVTPSMTGGVAHREVVTETQTRIAPKHVVVASGTVDQQRGVFFKLKPTPQTTLEGVHELTVRFTVPDTWRGDSLRVSCQALGQEKFLWLKQPKTWATLRAPIAVYLAGDIKARTAAKLHVRRSLSGS